MLMEDEMRTDEFNNTILPMRGELKGLACRLAGDTCTAEDMVQEAYLKLWNKRNELEIRTNVGAYCITLVRNLCFNLMQTRQYQSEEPLPEHFDLSSGDNPEQLTEAHDEQAQLKLLIGHLPSLQKRVLWLRDVNECSFKEIEQATGLTPVNIRVTLSRARKKIREEFNRITGRKNGNKTHC